MLEVSKYFERCEFPIQFYTARNNAKRCETMIHLPRCDKIYDVELFRSHVTHEIQRLLI